MNIATIEAAVEDVLKELSPESFIYRLLAAYGKPKASITRLQKGDLNLSKQPGAGEVIWKKNLLFRPLHTQQDSARAVGNPSPSIVRETVAEAWDLHVLADRMSKSEVVAKHGLRFIITTDWETLLAVDTKTAETLDIPITDLPKHVDFFLPWAGHEKHKSHNESLADIKAAYKMGNLYDQICKDNPGMSAEDTHALNVFLSRLLFCFFAEDTEIFPNKGMFTNAIASHTQNDGSDLNAYLDKLFDIMNTKERSNQPAYLQAFPYVNGGLFSTKLYAPKFSRQSRSIVLECGNLNWSEINPDIFGSMMQAVVHTEQRGSMHYTSVSNIMKVIEPLFLNELRKTFNESQDNPKALERLRAQLKNIKIFDPACGSGNFLIIAFKELRKLEMEIYLRLRELDPSYQALFTTPQIQLTQFCGIELDDFAHEIAILSLWLAEHQMNIRFKERLGVIVPALPLRTSGHIVCENATRLDWERVCPKNNNSEIYILGNPPYNGSKRQTAMQKEDMSIVFNHATVYKSLDYIASWFIKASRYIDDTRHKFAFVSTNSLTQGDQVALLWPLILERQQEIFFAHKTFKWGNNARNVAGVSCVIVGICAAKEAKQKILFDDNARIHAKNINPYLADATNKIIPKRNRPLSNLPVMVYGNMPLEGGFLKLTPIDKDKLLKESMEAVKFLRPLIGGDEFLGGIERWCLWIDDNELEEALKINGIKSRIEKVKEFRSSGGDVAKTLIEQPHQFRYRKQAKDISIIVPCTSSEKREYMPCGFYDNKYIVMNSAQVIYDPEPYIFGVLCSRLHMIWAKATAGRLDSRIRYSALICYNNFPIPNLTEKQKESITSHVSNIINEREQHPEKNIAQLYDPTNMPDGLLRAHRDLDAAIEQCYRSRPFNNDEERLEYLLQLYEELSVHA